MLNDNDDLQQSLPKNNIFYENNNHISISNSINCSNGSKLSHDFYKNCETSQSHFELNSSNIYVNENIKKKLKKLLNQYPEGIWCSELLNLYVKNYHYALDYKEFGCTSLIHFVSQIPDVIKLVRPGQGDWLLFDASQSELSDHVCSELQLDENLFHSDNNNIENERNNLYFDKDSLLIPKDVVGPEASWVKIDVNESKIIGTQFQISTAEVWSPNKFFVHIKKFSDVLEKFISDLQDFYNINFSKYKMPDSVIKPKQICVGYYSTDCMTREEWHRMQILQVLSKKAVTVYMVDFGTISVIKKTHLRFLHKSFLKFPIQAIPAKLVGIRPLNNASKWPATTAVKFLEFLRVPALKAEVVNVDHNFSVEYSVMYKSTEASLEFMCRLGLILYDISKPHILCINQQLVDDGLAVADGNFVFTKDQSNRSKNSNNAIQDQNDDEIKYNDQKDKMLNDINIQDKINEIKIAEEKESPKHTYSLESASNEFQSPNFVFHENFADSESENEKKIFEETSKKPEISNSNALSIVEPPGLENAKSTSNIHLALLFSLLLEQDNLNNATILELLVRNQDLQKVAVIDPLLALRLAFQMISNKN